MNFQNRPYDLTECDREPIHQIGTVQHFGGLIALNGDWVVAHRSVNCADILGLEALPAPGDRLADHFTPHAIEMLKLAFGRLSGEDAVERIFGLRLVKGGPLLDCAVHVSSATLIVEFEPHAEHEYADHLALIGPVLSQLETIREIPRLCDRAAHLVRDMLGYDRVMIYKFHRDDSGEVVAEARRDDMEAFLGLRYPRADIPQQARDLFRRNRFRVIADVDTPPVAIEPALDLKSRPLDLSMSVLRASSPVHLDYLRNMGVTATLTIAIVRHGRLWGLISCHHDSPKLPPYSLRTVAEMLSQMFSLMLDRILMERTEQLRAKGRELHDKLMLRFAGGSTLLESLPMFGEVLQDLILHDGASVMIEGRYKARGAAPDEDEFRAMIPALGSAPTSTIIASERLSDQIPEAEQFSDTVAGAIVLPISRSPREYFVLWRKPLVQTVTWAGDPAKAQASPGERLEPRGSFAAWEETVEGRSEDWSDEELQIAESLRVTLLEVVLRMTDEIARERKRAQEQQDLLIAELNHRVRNILNLIRSLVSQSQDEAMSVSEFTRILGGRISALASAHDNITRDNWAPASLAKLFETELGAYLDEKKDRFQLTGADVLVRPEAYTVLALVVHELVTNSAKYGSLCDRTGKLSVALRINRFGDLDIRWRESGGPAVKPPTRRGFGSTIIERSIPYELKGEAELRFEPSGLEADFTLPRRYLVLKDNAPVGMTKPVEEPETRGSEDSRILPEHVLLVEDSMIIALDTEESLKGLGIKSVAVEASVSGALAAIERRTPDFAIVDFNLGTETSEPVAQELAAKGVRFVLATGYAEMADEVERLGAVGLLRKPYGRSEIEELLSGAPAQ
ncbi:HWE histidine kinase domain-containing protein [Erythrobacter sp. GH1-10]|uniref:HWE histidine kinase domain-containing protein n=1 Tax=Erythrobacter sp. GH1-10 TaxID=3349334 RepID=UPI003877E26B